MADGERYSDYFVTINTHKPFDSDLFDALEVLVRERLAAEVARVFDIDAERVHASYVSDVGIELTKNRRQLHAHFVWEVTHSTRIHNGPRNSSDGRGVNARLQELVNEALGIEGAYAHVKLLAQRSRSKNYARKGGENRTFLADLRPIDDADARH